MRRPLLSVLLVLTTAAAASAQPNGALPGPLPLFPPDNWWNLDISDAPVDPNSAGFLDFIGDVGMHPDFGAKDSFPAIYGMVYVSVPGSQPLRQVTFVEYGAQSDAGAPGRPAGYPIPDEAKTQPLVDSDPRWIEGGHPGNVAGCPSSDRHMLIVDRDNRLLYELYHLCWNTVQNRWEAGSGAIFSLDGNNTRPDTWTSADASGMAILPGLVRYDEVMSGEPIRHAFRFTVFPVNGYVFPASHDASTSVDPDALPLGARLRLKESTLITGYPDYIQRIFQAMKTYGLINADNGSDMYVQGNYHPDWDNDVLNPAFADLTPADFEVIELGWHPSTAVSPAGRDFYTLAPCRLVDTRLAPGPTEPGSSGAPALYPGQPGQTSWSRVFRAAGQCGVPATAKAVSLNVTAVAAAAGGTFAFYPGDQLAAPGASAVSFGPGQTRAGNVVVALSASGSGTLAVQNTSGGPAAVVVDVNGYFE